MFDSSDPQKRKVYEAEWGHSAYNHIAFRKSATAEKWTNGIVGNRFFGKMFPHMAHSPISIYDDVEGDSCTSYTISNAIDIPRWGMRKLIICHELAHLCNTESESFQYNRECAGLGRRKKRGLASHGPRFCGIYIKIVNLALGKEAARELKYNFRYLGVQYECN